MGGVASNGGMAYGVVVYCGLWRLGGELAELKGLWLGARGRTKREKGIFFSKDDDHQCWT